MSKKTDDYDVGYGKPPKASQFKPGQSGNRRGRPKGRSGTSKSVATTLEDMLNKQVLVRDGNGTRKVTMLEAILHGIGVRAFKGDAKAVQAMITLARHTKLFEPAAEQQPQHRGVLVVPAQLGVDEWIAQYGIGRSPEAEQAYQKWLKTK